MPELICYTSNVRRSWEHLVPLLGREVLSLRSFLLHHCWTPDYESAPLSTSCNKLPNALAYFGIKICQSSAGQKVQGGNERRHLGGAQHNRGGLSVTTQTVFTEKLYQAAVRGEIIDSLLRREKQYIYREVSLTSCSQSSGSEEEDKNNK